MEDGVNEGSRHHLGCRLSLHPGQIGGSQLILETEAMAGAATASALSSEMTKTVRRRRIFGDLLCCPVVAVDDNYGSQVSMKCLRNLVAAT